MGAELVVESKDTQYIARISHGKDSLKMLDVIVSRGLPLDRITTTDVWATDTIRGEHPKMVEFKARADEYIWRTYHIEVEHLCATRNGEKMTYEKLFYHVPQRKDKKCGGGVANSKGRSSASRPCGGLGASQTSSEQQRRPQGFPAQRGSWCKKLKIDYIRLPGQYQPKGTMVPEAQNQVFRKPRREGRYKYHGIPRHSRRRAETVRPVIREKTGTAR